MLRPDPSPQSVKFFMPIFIIPFIVMPPLKRKRFQPLAKTVFHANMFKVFISPLIFSHDFVLSIGFALLAIAEGWRQRAGR